MLQEGECDCGPWQLRARRGRGICAGRHLHPWLHDRGSDDEGEVNALANTQVRREEEQGEEQETGGEDGRCVLLCPCHCVEMAPVNCARTFAGHFPLRVHCVHCNTVPSRGSKSCRLPSEP